MRAIIGFLVVIQMVFNIWAYRKLTAASKEFSNLLFAISDYNFIAGANGLPQIGQSIDGKVIKGTHQVDSEQYESERSKVDTE